MNKKEMVNYVKEILKEQNIGRITLAKELGISEMLAREILAIAKWELEKEEQFPSEEEYALSYKIAIPPNAKVAILSDIHFPFHCNFSLEKALEKIKEFNPDIILLNGDIVDFYQLSTFSKNPNIRDVYKGIEYLKNFICELRKFRESIIYYRLGNHENRLFKYVWTKAQELSDIINIFNEKDLNVDKILYTQDYLYFHNPHSSLHIFHGHELRLSANLVYVAENLLRKYKTNIIISHYHTVQKTISNILINGEYYPIGAWVVGALCKRPLYGINNHQLQNGFALLKTFQDYTFEVLNYIILPNLKKVILA